MNVTKVLFTCYHSVTAHKAKDDFSLNRKTVICSASARSFLWQRRQKSRPDSRGFMGKGNHGRGYLLEQESGAWNCCISNNFAIELSLISYDDLWKTLTEAREASTIVRNHPR